MKSPWLGVKEIAEELSISERIIAMTLKSGWAAETYCRRGAYTAAQRHAGPWVQIKGVHWWVCVRQSHREVFCEPIDGLAVLPPVVEREELGFVAIILDEVVQAHFLCYSSSVPAGFRHLVPVPVSHCGEWISSGSSKCCRQGPLDLLNTCRKRAGYE